MKFSSARNDAQLHLEVLRVCGSLVGIKTAFIRRCVAFQTLLQTNGVVFWVCAFLMGHLMLPVRLRADPDLMWLLAGGKFIIESRSIPLHDPFAWTNHDTPWMNHEWLSSVIFYLLYSSGGEFILYLYKLVLFATTASLLRAAFMVSQPFCGTGILSISFVLCYGSYVWGSTIRCHTLTYLLFSFTLCAIEYHRLRGIRWMLVLVAVLMPLWTNAHGGFVLGVLALGLYAASELVSSRGRRIFASLCFIGGALGTLINPYGVDYLHFMVFALNLSRPFIGEWKPVPFFSCYGILMTLTMLAILWTVFVERVRLHVFAAIIIAVCFHGAFQHIRFVLLPLLATISLYPVGVQAFFSRLRSVLPGIDLRLPATLWGISLLVVAPISLVKVLSHPQDFSWTYQPYPVKPVDWALRNLPPGRLLNDVNAGGYILKTAYPHLLVSMDGRCEQTYRDEWFQKNRELVLPSTEGRFKEINEIRPDYILFSRSVLLKEAEYQDSWKIVYQDGEWVLLARR